MIFDTGIANSNIEKARRIMPSCTINNQNWEINAL